MWGSKNKRRNICKFRISNHKLEIERGRYFNIPASNRICKLCKNGVENEIHFLLDYPALNTVRKPIMDTINSLYPQTKHLNANENFIWLLSCEDDVIFSHLDKLLFSLNEERTIQLASQ